MFELNNNNSNAIKSSRYLDKGFEHDLSKKEIIYEVLLLPIYKIADDSSIINKQDEVQVEPEVIEISDSDTILVDINEPTSYDAKTNKFNVYNLDDILKYYDSSDRLLVYLDYPNEICMFLYVQCNCVEFALVLDILIPDDIVILRSQDTQIIDSTATLHNTVYQVGVTITTKLRSKDNVIVETRHNAKASIIGKIIGDICDKHSNIKYKNAILNNIVVLP